MVEFSRYVQLAYEAARAKEWYEREMVGSGTQGAHQRFMQALGEAYNKRGHDEATVAEARAFLEEAVAPP